MFIDTHCHIEDQYYGDIDTLIEEIKKSNVSKIIVNGCNMESNLKVLELVSKYDIVYGALGFHPTELEDYDESCLVWLEKHINDSKIVAVGEIGLDYHYDDTDKSKQVNVFKKQLEIAQKYKKPIIIHSRDAIQDTYDILSKYRLVGGSIHCFSGSLEIAKRFINLGYMIGVGGVCTYKNSKIIKDVIKNIDLEYILLETDAPYLTPEPYRGLQNSSKYIPVIAKKIAELKDVSLDKVGEATSNNANRCFFSKR